MRKLLIGIALVFCISFQAQAQLLTGISTYWDDSFAEWLIYTEDEDEEGTLQPRWINRGDWTEWEWELGDESVMIKQSFRNDPSQWEIRGYNGDIVTCRTAWKNDVSEWKITNNSVTIVFKTRYANNPNEWQVREQYYGQFAVYTNQENDPRDWIIVDELDENITPNMKIAMVFIAIYNSIPRG